VRWKRISVWESRQFHAIAFARLGLSCAVHLGAKSKKRSTTDLLGWLPFVQRGQRMSWDPVYRLVKQIPRGRVTTYGALAKTLRLRGGARTAGRAMAATPSGKGIPWHRVVGDHGKLLIPEPYGSLQRKMLRSEGVEIVEFRVNLKKYLWTPGRRRTAKSGVI
jgi:methylated-DNA-protein-cysteine methyltransferase related protein